MRKIVGIATAITIMTLSGCGGSAGIEKERV